MKNLGYAAMLLLATACHNQVAPDCGCEGSSTNAIHDVWAVYKSDLVTGVDPKDYFYRPCNPAFLDGKISAGDTILVSGKLHSSCFTGETFIAQPGLLEITDVRKK